jgi:hypothetical protein
MSLWENDPSKPWEHDVPADVIPAVKHLRRYFENAHFRFGWTTRSVCYSQLHGGIRSPHDDDYGPALDQLKSDLRPAALRFERRLLIQTLPAIFAAFHQFYIDGVCAVALANLADMIAIGRANEDRLPCSALEWAEAQARHMIRSERHLIPLWIRDVCDDRIFDPTEEQIYWREWQAPLLLIMKPSRFQAYDEKRIWERMDPQSSAETLEGFADEYVLQLETEVKEEFGLTAVDLAKQPNPQKSPASTSTKAPASAESRPTSVLDEHETARSRSTAQVQTLPASDQTAKEESDDAPWQQLSSDFAKLAGEEKSANAFPLNVMVISESNHSSDLADWKISDCQRQCKNPHSTG